MTDINKMLEIQKKGSEAAMSKEAQEKRKLTFESIGHQQGTKNSQYNTVWIHNIELKQNRKVPKDSPIPDGWILGRIVDFDAHEKKLLQKKKQQEMAAQKKQDKIKYYENMYDVYINKGFDYIKNTLHYDKTQENLIMMFRKYVKNYVPYDRARA